MKRTTYSRAEICKGMVPFPEQIAITGSSGVGKTVLLKIIKRMLKGKGYRFVSGGSITRAFQKKFGYKEIGDYVRFLARQRNFSHDLLIDGKLRQAGLDFPMIVLEARLAHIFLPNGFKVLLICALDVCAMRRHKKIPAHSFRRHRWDLLKRDRRDIRRNSQRNPGCIWKEKDFDLVLSTEDNTPEQLAEKIFAGQIEWFKRSMAS